MKRVKKGDYFYRISLNWDTFIVVPAIDYHIELDDSLFKRGNYFTEKDKALDKCYELQALMRRKK